MKDILQLMVQLEDDVAEFYKNMATMRSLKKYASVFDFMSVHSQDHSKTVRNIAGKFDEIPLKKQKFVVFQSRLKQEMLRKISGENDIKAVSDILAEAEGLMGYAYEQIANHMENNGKLMLEAAKAIRKIADEEKEHKNQVKRIGETG